jgi:aryl-alcohol dehydrogenase-like predicted oxidoreductase
VLPYCDAQGIAFLPFSPLGRGFLTGNFASVDDLPEGDWRRTLPRFQADTIAANQALVTAVRAIAARRDATPAQVALAWVRAQGSYVVPIPGTKTPKYLADNAGAAEVTLTAEDLSELDALPAPEGSRY